MELTEFAVNIPLADEFFHFDESTKSRIAEEPVMGAVEPHRLVREAAPGLPCAPSSMWVRTRSTRVAARTWRIGMPCAFLRPNAALVFWRRSPPPAQADGARDWLSNLTMVVPGTLSGRSDAAARIHLPVSLCRTMEFVAGRARRRKAIGPQPNSLHAPLARINDDTCNDSSAAE